MEIFNLLHSILSNRIDSPHNPVHIKIADYGISRIALPTGTKGFGGTEGFMAPEIICHNGEEEYTEKVVFNLNDTICIEYKN